ncbi:MAG: ester cyclase [Verrucomicrobia bacterium]|nr:ester cyclase [Verrucomicrobiota bacterium]
MTTEANKQVVREFIAAVNRQDWRRFDELVAPDFVRHSSTFGQSYVSDRDRLREYLIAEFKTFPDAWESINFMVAEEDKVTVHSHCRATQQGPMGSWPATGRVLSADFISIYRIANGRIVEAWAEWDALNGLIQLGHLKAPM